MIVACLVATAVLVHPGLFHSAKADGGSMGTWAQTYSSGFPGFGASNAIQQTSDGGYILVGDTNPFGQAWVIRLDASGNVIWENAYSKAGGASARSVQQTSDGGFIIAGHTSISSSTCCQAWVLRLDGDGNVIWENAYSGLGTAFASSVQLTSDGGFIVAGRTFGSGLTEQAWVLSLDGDGNVNWEKAYGGSGFDTASSVQQTSDGGFIVAGETSSFGPSSSNAWVFRLDSNGNIIWENAYGNGGEFAWSVQETSDGGFVIGVEDLTSIPNTEAAAVILLDGDGNIVWQHAYSTPNGCNAAVSVKQTSDNGFIVGTACDNTVLRLDDQGNIVWQNTYGGLQVPSVDSVQQTTDGGFVLAGCCTNFAAFVAKIDSDGQIGSSCASITPSSLTQSDTSYTVTPTSATVTDTSSLDIITPTSSTVTDTSGSDVVTLLC